jgi:hypothetical protein
MRLTGHRKIESAARPFGVVSYLCATALSLAADCAISRLTGRRRRLQQKPNRVVVLMPIADMIRGGKEVMVTVLDADLGVFIHRNQAAHFIVDAQKLVALHVPVIRIFRYPQLENGFVPAIRFAAAVNGFKRGGLNFRQMVTGMNDLPMSVRED